MSPLSMTGVVAIEAGERGGSDMNSLVKPSASAATGSSLADASRWPGWLIWPGGRATRSGGGFSARGQAVGSGEAAQRAANADKLRHW